MKKLFIGIILCMCSVAGSLIGLGILMGWLLLSPAKAQQQQQRPGQGPNCMDLGTAKADAQYAKIMLDAEGDWWILLRFTSTGRQLIGFISRQTGMFCVTGEGRANPES